MTRSKRTVVEVESVDPNKYKKRVKEKDAIDKLSHVELSNEQITLKDDIIKFCENGIKEYKEGDKPRVFIIRGGAGTGKSVVLNSLFNDIQQISKNGDKEVLKDTRNYLLVNHPEMIRLYHRVIKSFEWINKSEIERPTSYINGFNKTHKGLNDIVIIDEAHLLATCKNAYKRFLGDNHLSEVIKTCKVIIIVYDEEQTLRTDQYWGGIKGSTSLNDILEGNVELVKEYTLREQWRMQGKGSLEVYEWIKRMCFDNEVYPYPKECIDVGDDGKTFEFKVFDNCQEMYDKIKEKDEIYGQCRMLSTYDQPYRLQGKWYVHGSGGFKLMWDKFTPGAMIPWSERRDTIDEVGSVYTIQGLDVNYAGVIIGPSVRVESDGQLQIDVSKYEDKAGTSARGDMKRGSRLHQLAVEKMIRNSLYVLLTRPVRGLYVCFI